MNDKEFLKVCCIDNDKLERYIDAGILDKHNINENDICLITSLESIGCSLSSIKTYLDNYHHNHDICLQILQKQRNNILNDIHGIQKNVDMIDELMKQLKEEK